MGYCYRQRTLKSVDGRDTSFAANSKGTVYDRIGGTMVKVGTINREGNITVFPKYNRKYGDRLHVLEAKKPETTIPKEK